MLNKLYNINTDIILIVLTAKLNDGKNMEKLHTPFTLKSEFSEFSTTMYTYEIQP